MTRAYIAGVGESRDGNEGLEKLSYYESFLSFIMEPITSNDECERWASTRNK